MRVLSTAAGRQAWWGFAVMVFVLCSCRHVAVQKDTPPERLGDRQVAVLNALRDEINLIYGFENGWPRINRGPCGRFAKLFREHWNARFKDKINIVFVMMADMSDGVGCNHVLVKLPDENYFDGGSGVISEAALLGRFGPMNRIEEMVDFDFARLDKNSYGLNRAYELCPNYSDETTARIIEKHLDLLTIK